MSQSLLSIRGAREHNLKNVDLDLPRNKLIVITGLSGSGKSSLAFDTIYAEGQRRYVESLSPYARQFLEKFKKPEVDYISGLSPSISIEQKQTSRNPRSTIATVTEIYDYLRLLYAKVGEVHCHQCGQLVSRQSHQEITETIMRLGRDKIVAIMAPIVRERKGEYRKQFEDIRKKGYVKVRIDGKMCDLTDGLKLTKSKRHNIDVVVDHLRVQKGNEVRILNAVEAAGQLANGMCLVVDQTKLKGKRARKSNEYLFSEKMNCTKCQIGFPELTPNMFSFNSPQGACTRCRGIGKVTQLMESAVIKNPGKSLLAGAINKDLFFSFNSYFVQDLVEELVDYYQFDIKTPWQELPEEARDAFFWGNDQLYGLYHELREQFYKAKSLKIRMKIQKFMEEQDCPLCEGKRLKKESLGVKVGAVNLVELTSYDLTQVNAFFEKLKLSSQQKEIVGNVLYEIKTRVEFLLHVGLGYLTLDRSVATLGGGEYQRIRLASQISTGLTGVLYVLDEPSIGLHPRDHEKLLQTLEKLRDLKNTVVVVEHDEETIRRADYVVDLGPGAGRFGGELVGKGTTDELIQQSTSLTGQYLGGLKQIEVPKKRNKPKQGKWIKILGAKEHNLKNISIKIPVGLFTCMTGVSGSGKSTLVHDILSVSLRNHFWKTNYKSGKHRAIRGVDLIDSVIEIDQSPIGRSPRSNPATYTDMFGIIRHIFSQVPESKLRNYNPGRFSFNLKAGRCADCQGDGTKHLTMSFLPDVYVQCETCRGQRYNVQTLEVHYKGKNIAEILDMTIEQALDFFQSVPRLRERLEILNQIGLGYLHLGQPSTTLSGGEAQRIKLAAELAKKPRGKILYILDEPTTGLHFDDIRNLVNCLIALRDSGHTVLVIEHNLDLVKMADYVIDLGPDGGIHGGELIVEGTPEKVAKNASSWTGKYLRNYLKSI